MYVKINASNEVEQYPYTLGNLRGDNPNTSFPKKIPNTILEGYLVYPVEVLDAPSCEPLTQHVIQNTTPVLNGTKWQVSWIVSDLSLEQAAINVRFERDIKLAKTDWMASSDVTMSSEWRTYRQALRDVPDQLPSTNVTWPTDPS